MRYESVLLIDRTYFIIIEFRCYELTSGTTSTDSESSTNPGTMGNQEVLAVEHLGQSHVTRPR